MKTMEQRLFTPGDGSTPPALTGREREEAVLTRCLADLLGDRAPPHNVALTGPRGTGKTVLLNWFKRACRDREPGLDANADSGQVQTALTALQRLGFVWRPPGQLPPVRYEPGIPSLMAYVLDHAAPTHGQALPETR